MKLHAILSDKKPDILDRWCILVRETYPAQTATMLGKVEDRFANPVEHFIRDMTGSALDHLLGEADLESVREGIDRLIRIRTVQDFTPSQAAGVMFLVKRIVREDYGTIIRERGLEWELLEWESEVDRVALLAFEVYTVCLSTLYEIRVREIRNRSAVLFKRFQYADDDPVLRCDPEVPEESDETRDEVS